MSEPRILNRHVIRTLLAFCRLEGGLTDADAREDVSDSCAGLLDSAFVGEDALREWCADADGLLSRLPGSHALLRAQARLLRLRVAVGAKPAPAAPVKKPAERREASAVKTIRSRGLGKNALRVHDWLKENSGVRTREVVARFAGELSDRTVIRALKDLVNAGIARKVEDGGSVAYEVVDTTV